MSGTSLGSPILIMTKQFYITPPTIVLTTRVGRPPGRQRPCEIGGQKPPDARRKLVERAELLERRVGVVPEQLHLQAAVSSQGVLLLL